MTDQTPTDDAESVLRNKCVALIHATRRRLHELDPGLFPAESTKEALAILTKTIERIGEAENLRQARPTKVYPALLSLQDLIQDIELSGSYHLSWPLIELLGDAFSKLVAHGDIAAFYATMKEHNYRTISYNQQYQRLLGGALPARALASILGTRQLLCVELPSVEEEHPALHTNVLHEFGHVLLDNDSPFAHDFVRVWLREFRPFFTDVERDIVGNTEDKQDLRFALGEACYQFASELVCDCFGAAVVGPAFSIAYGEMRWNKPTSFWIVQPSSSGRGLRAHPGFSFRVEVLKGLRSYQSFRDGAVRLFPRLKTPELNDFDRLMDLVDTRRSTDRIAVNRFLGIDSDSAQSILNDRLTKLKDACRRVVMRFEPLVVDRLKGILDPVKPQTIFELLRRLEQDLTPNTAKDTIPCGLGADFQSILAAGLYYRLGLLSVRSQDETRMVRSLNIADQLVAKAIEQSYVQHHANVVGGG